MGGRAHGYRLSPDHFQTVKRMLAPDWAQKMLCIIVPNRRTVSPEFFSWVRTRQLYLATVARFVHQAFLTRNEGTTDESKNVSDAISKSNSIALRNSVSDGSQFIVNNTKFKMWRWRESKKSNSLTRQNNNFPRASCFLVYSYFEKGCRKNVHATVPKGNMGYVQYTFPDTVALKPTFVAFL